ncbi:MAG TPA: RIO1 family regulatory kinase/ATPase [Jatrophihabitans sp.]|jgi:RIO kinase 1
MHFDDISIEPFVEPNYSTWDIATHGPEPRPDWVVTALAAVDTELGVLKTGKEADVHLLSRRVPGGPEMLIAAKRYRTAEHRTFHRDAGYTEGRRVRKSRERRALARRTDFGRELAAGQWAAAEFQALSTLWDLGAPVPYPVQLYGTELLLEFIGTPDGQAAPRLAQARPDSTELALLFEQCVEAMRLLARSGLAHGDLSPYNLLVDDGRIVMIDLPQIVDLVANPQGLEYLHRDCENVCTWFARRGLQTVEFDHLYGDLVAEALGSW